MQLPLKAFRIVLFLTLLVGLAATAARVEAYTPFYELSAPTRMGSDTRLIAGHVDVATGAFCFKKHLATVTGYPTLSQDVYFHSQDSSNGPFGKGTSTSYDWFVTHSTTWPGSPWVLIGPGNHHYIFDTVYQGTSGLYADPRDPHMLGAVLSFNAPPGGDLCTVTFKNHDYWEFDLSGGLIAMHSRVTNTGSNTLTIQRDSVTGFVTYVYQTLTPTMRATHFTYSGSPAVCSQMEIDYNYTWGVSAGTIQTWAFTYTAGNTRLTTLTDVQGRVSSLNWTSYTRSDGISLPLVQNMVDNRGNTTLALTYDSSGRVISGALPVSGSMTFGWNGGIGTASYVTVTFPGGHAYNISWLWHTANTGYWINVVHDLALAAYTTFEKNAGPTYLNTAVVDYLGRRYTLSWDTAEGNLLSYTYPTAAGGTATYNYQYDPAFHKLSRITDPLGNVTSQGVDANTGDITSRTDALGNTTTFQYAGPGYCYFITDPLGHSSSRTFDPVTGGMTSETDANRNMTTYALDVIGNVLSATLPNGHAVTYAYNGNNSLASTSQSAAGTPITEVYARDGNDNVISFTDANSHVWTTAFDAANRVVSSTNPLGVSRTWSYNPDNTINVSTDPMGQTGTTTYDAAGRPTVQAFRASGGGTIESTISYTYDPTSQLLSSVNDSAFGVSTLTRDGALQATSTTQPYGTVSRTYDLLGRPASETLSGQPTVSYHYNALGLMDSETQNSLTTSFVYDADGRLVKQQFPNGVTVTQVLDSTGATLRATSTKGASTLDDTVYTRDAMGNVKTARTNGGTQVSYTYDGLNRLTAVSSPADYYQYDFVGNRTLIQLNGGSEHFYYYDAANTLTRIDGAAVAANAAGVTTGYNGAAYTWDIRGRLTGYTAAGVAASFKYFPTGLPAQQVINGVTTNRVMSGADILGEITGGVTTLTLNSPNFGAPVSRGGLYHSTDGLGDTTLLTDTGGSVVQSYSYTPLGVVTKATGTDSPYQFRGSYNAGLSFDRTGKGLYDPVNPPLLHAQASFNGPQYVVSRGSFGGDGPMGFIANHPPVGGSSFASGMEGQGIGYLPSRPMGTGYLVRGPIVDPGLQPPPPLPPPSPTPAPTAETVNTDDPNYDWSTHVFSSGRTGAEVDAGLQRSVAKPSFDFGHRPFVGAADPGGMNSPEGGDGSAAGGALSLAFILVSPNPFSPTGETPLDEFILDPLWRHFHPPHYNPGLEAALAADGTEPVGVPSDGPGSPLIPWPPS